MTGVLKLHCIKGDFHKYFRNTTPTEHLVGCRLASCWCPHLCLVSPCLFNPCVFHCSLLDCLWQFPVLVLHVVFLPLYCFPWVPITLLFPFNFTCLCPSLHFGLPPDTADVLQPFWACILRFFLYWMLSEWALGNFSPSSKPWLQLKLTIFGWTCSSIS